MRLAIAFRLRMAVAATRERKLLLRGQHQPMPADEGEVENAQHKVDQRSVDTRPIGLIRVEGD